MLGPRWRLWRRGCSSSAVFIAFMVFGPGAATAPGRSRRNRAARGAAISTRARPNNGGDEVAAVARIVQQDGRGTRQPRARARGVRQRPPALLADVSHELMTPLTAMRGYIETLVMSELKLDAPTRERYLRIVTDETHRLESIIGDLLDLARLEGGGTRCVESAWT